MDGTGRMGVGNSCQMKEVLTADRGREKVFIQYKRMNVKGWGGRRTVGAITKSVIELFFTIEINLSSVLLVRGFLYNIFGWENQIFITICPVLLLERNSSSRKQWNKRENISISISI